MSSTDPHTAIRRHPARRHGRRRADADRAEKLRVVHALDELGVGDDQGRLPGVEPKGAGAVRAARRRAAQVAQIVAFGMTRRRERGRARTRGCGCWPSSFAPACTIVGKASVLHVEKVVRVSREENLAMIADSVAFLRGAGKRVLLDAEHFFDGFALDPGYALDCLRAAADAGAERSCCATPTAARCRLRSARRSRSSREALPGGRSASTPTTTAAAASPTR